MQLKLNATAQPQPVSLFQGRYRFASFIKVMRLTRTETVAACLVVAVTALLSLSQIPEKVGSKSPGIVRTMAIDSPMARSTYQRIPLPSEKFVASDFPHTDVVGTVQDHWPPADKSVESHNLVQLTQASHSRFDRHEAIATLGTSRDAMAEMTLIGLLYDPDPAIRESAVESLSAIGTQGAVQGLGFALTDANPLVRQSALEFLVATGTPDARATLTALLNDPDVDIRLAAVYELADVGGETATGLLQQFLSDANATVRDTAYELLNE